MDNEILNVLIEKFYNLIELREGKAEFKDYKINSKEMLYLLQKLDSDRYDMQIEMLKEAKDE